MRNEEQYYCATQATDNKQNVIKFTILFTKFSYRYMVFNLIAAFTET